VLIVKYQASQVPCRPLRGDVVDAVASSTHSERRLIRAPAKRLAQHRIKPPPSDTHALGRALATDCEVDVGPPPPCCRRRAGPPRPGGLSTGTLREKKALGEKALGDPAAGTDLQPVLALRGRARPADVVGLRERHGHDLVEATALAWQAPCGCNIRVRGEITGAPKCRIVGKSQSGPIMIHPMISTRTPYMSQQPCRHRPRAARLRTETS
jgi:hypothetical protein